MEKREREVRERFARDDYEADLDDLSCLLSIIDDERAKMRAFLEASGQESIDVFMEGCDATVWGCLGEDVAHLRASVAELQAEVNAREDEVFRLREERAAKCKRIDEQVDELNAQETVIAQVREERDAERARADGLSDEQRETRMALWAGHGHEMLYGDDGEMQCGKCGPVLPLGGLWDYLRSPLPALAKQVANMAARERARADAEYALRTEMLDKATARRIELELLARDLASNIRESYGLLAVHHMDMKPITVLLARAAETLRESPNV